MHRDHFLKFSLVFALLGSICGASSAADSESETTLKSKGLSKVLSTWVIEDEKPVLASFKDAKATFHSYAQVADRQAEAEQLVAQSKLLEEQRVEMQNNLNTLNQQIAAMPNPAAGVNPRMARYYQQTPANNPLLAQKSELTTALAELNQTQKNIKSQIPSAKDKSAIDAEVKSKQEAFKLTLTDLRKQVDDVTKKYADLAADDSVKTAIDELKKSTKAKVKLGPSDAFLAVVKELDQAERRYLGKTPPPSAASAKKKAKAKK